LQRRSAPGTEPGTLIADPLAQSPRINVIAFGADDLHEEQNVEAGQIGALVDRYPVTWVDVQGLGDVNVICALGEVFGLHRLALEDVVNVHQRPKAEEFDDHLFMVPIGESKAQMCDFAGYWAVGDLWFERRIQTSRWRRTSARPISHSRLTSPRARV
jgi:hypothetical protein